MNIYLVGGAVRDQLLDYPFHERDWVVVGASPKQMLSLGYEQVGKDFPVFLHPTTKEEYALARTERKSAPGYHGFDLDYSSDVTLEQDLSRRDFTINAIAQDNQGNLIDPYQGQVDIDNKILKHVSDAFAEDPVRILRGARFLARYAHLGFTVDKATLSLMQSMVDNGEVDALVKERVWREFESAMAERTPIAAIDLLQQVGALQRLLPQLAAAWSTMRVTTEQKFNQLPRGAALDHVALLYSSLGEQDLIDAKAPNRFIKLTKQLNQLGSALTQQDAKRLLLASTSQGLLKQPDTLATLSNLLKIVKPNLASAVQWLDLIAQLSAIVPAPFIKQGLQGAAIGEALKQAQLTATEQWLNAL